MSAGVLEMSLSVKSIVVAAKDQICCDLAGEEVILDLRSGVYYGLDAVGARIWRLLQSETSIADIRDTIMSEYEVEREQCEADLLEFLTTMAGNGLVEIR